MKIKVKAGEMTEANVDWISLVNNPANKIPFKVIKEQENKMIDLDALRLVKKDEGSIEPDYSPVVTAIYTNESDLEAKEQVLKDSGFSVEDKEVKEGIVVFKQEGYDPKDNGVTVSLKEFAVSAKVKKSFSSWSESTNFTEIMAQEGVFNGLYEAGSAVNKALSNILYSVEDKETAAKKLKSVLSDYQAYVLSLVENLPVTAFKLEGYSSPSPAIKDESQEEDMHLSASPDSEVGETEEEVQEGGKELEASDQDPEKKVVVKEIEEPDNEVLGTLKSLASMVGDLQVETQKLKGEVSSLKEVSDRSKSEIESKVVSLAQRVKSFGEEVDLGNIDQEAPKQSVSKNDGVDGWNFDSAYDSSTLFPPN
jgi:hypothetical protein